jgi:hypothetical protein
VAHSHTPRTRCVRFVFGVAAASRNTRLQAARYGLTWVGLAPTDRASFAWRLPSRAKRACRLCRTLFTRRRLVDLQRQREPRPGNESGRWGGVPESLGGPWVGGCRRTPEGTYNDRPFIEALQATGPLTFHQPLTMQRIRLGRRIDVATQGRSAHPSTLADARRCRPTP